MIVLQYLYLLKGNDFYIFMRQYHDLLKKVLGGGDVQFDPRTQESVLGLSVAQSTYDLREGFPLITTKNIPPRLPFEELFWKLRGERNVKSLVDRKVDIWTANAFDRYLKTQCLQGQIPKHSDTWNQQFASYQARLKEYSEFAKVAGDLGPVYGHQWRHWKKTVFVKGHSEGTECVPDEWRIEEIDQLERLVEGIKKKPGSRYHVLNAWNTSELADMALGPCPFWHQFTVYGNKIDLTMVQRSCDVFLGVPFNIAQDSLLLHMVARETGLEPRKFNHSLVNVHAYLGVVPRANFWADDKNVKEFQEEFNAVSNREGYLELRGKYLKIAGSESEGNERKDHIPFILEQLSKEPRDLPSIKLVDIPLLEAIQKPVVDVVHISGYDSHKWDSKAIMAT